MALARYKDFCIDAVDAARSGRFWAMALDLGLELMDDGDAVLRDSGGGAAVWINAVPEPRTAKNRIHIDLAISRADGGVDALVAAGATVQDADSFRWTVMTDPEGQEFCAFVRDEPVRNRLYELVWDCPDDAAACHDIASWWAEVLGARLVDDERGFSYLLDLPTGPWESFDFVPVPEPKSAKNRVHIDVWAEDVAALVGHGATVLRPQGPDLGWTVLADPLGNEFCAFVPRTGT